MKFVRRRRGNPCPICDHESWCTVTSDGELIRCMRVKSDRKSIATDGTCGYLHKSAIKMQTEPLPKKEKKRLTSEQVTEIAERCFQEGGPMREHLAEELGVSVASLCALRVGRGFDYDGTEYSSWPSRNFRRDIIGISRRYADGSKKTMCGTRNGVFVSVGYENELNERPVLIVEGGTDVCAAFDLGRFAIGRPSNTGGVPILRAMLRHHPDVLVVGENDCAESRRGLNCPADCQGCACCFPGRWGAMEVAKKLHCRYWMPPVGKDFREYVASGRTRVPAFN